jgi:protein-tyrosine-phosphatase
MIGEDLDRRARRHAALGDPTRLHIADRLAFGDLSPGELAAALGVPGNLLAHHLHVLERAGVVRRVRSEGDGRRVYVSLAGPVPDIGPPVATPHRIVFVCTRNSARSQFAAATWRSASDIPAESAGTHPAPEVHPLAVTTGRRRGLRLDGARPVHVRDVLAPTDLVVAVCDAAHESLDPDRPRLHWSIPDPVRSGTPEAFEAALDEVEGRVDRLAAALTG